MPPPQPWPTSRAAVGGQLGRVSGVPSSSCEPRTGTFHATSPSGWSRRWRMLGLSRSHAPGTTCISTIPTDWQTCSRSSSSQAVWASEATTRARFASHTSFGVPDAHHTASSGFSPTMGLIDRSARVFVTVAVIALATLAPMAHAGVDLPLRSDAFLPLGPPALAGDDLLWAQRRGSGFDLMQRSRSGAVRSILFRQGLPNRTATARLEASATNFVLETSQSYPVTCAKCDPPLPLLTVEAGTLGGRLAQVGGTCEYDPTLFTRSIDVDGATFVSHGPDCRHWTAGVIRGDGSTELASLPDGIAFPRIAGRYVAWLELTPNSASGNVGDVVVRDRDSDTETYRLPRASLGFVSSLALRDDGTVALSSLSTPGQGHVEW